MLVSSSTDLDTTLVLVNAIYFKGMWKTAFNAEDTREMPFHVTKVGDMVTAPGQDRKPSRVPHTPSYSHWSMVLLGPSLTGHGAEPKTGWQKLCLTRHPKHTCRQERKMETQLEDPAQFL